MGFWPFGCSKNGVMAYVITDSCTKDGLCIEACPVDCIHPKPDEPAFESAPQLYVDPDQCIDCGACIPVCPSNSLSSKNCLQTRSRSPRRTQRFTHDDDPLNAPLTRACMREFRGPPAGALPSWRSPRRRTGESPPMPLGSTWRPVARSGWSRKRITEESPDRD